MPHLLAEKIEGKNTEEMFTHLSKYYTNHLRLLVMSLLSKGYVKVYKYSNMFEEKGTAKIMAEKMQVRSGQLMWFFKNDLVFFKEIALADINTIHEIKQFDSKYARIMIGSTKNMRDLLLKLNYKESTIDTIEKQENIIKQLFDDLNYEEAKLKFGIRKL